VLLLIYSNKERCEILKYLILVSHGQFAEGVKTSLEMFAGDNTKYCFALCLHDGESAEEYGNKVEHFFQKKKFKNDDEFVVLADIIGGSPLTTFLGLFSQHKYFKNSVILGGMNFSMALTALVSLEIMAKDKIAETALSEGLKAMKQYNMPQDMNEAEDNI
jgi:N-acetylgalactosamine PTS system EIIA component